MSKQSRLTQFILVAMAILAVPKVARAGFVEIGGSGNYRKSYIDQFNYTTVQSLTGSIAYYFWEMSAIEASYTNGQSTSVTTSYTASAYFEMTGLDFVMTFGEKDSAFRPYAKLGAAYQKKQIVYEQVNQNPITDQTEGPSPSAGVGFKLGVTQNFGIKVGVEAWTSPLSNTSSSNPVTYDIAARAGISWIF